MESVVKRSKYRMIFILYALAYLLFGAGIMLVFFTQTDLSFDILFVLGIGSLLCTLAGILPT